MLICRHATQTTQAEDAEPTTWERIRAAGKYPTLNGVERLTYVNRNKVRPPSRESGRPTLPSRPIAYTPDLLGAQPALNDQGGSQRAEDVEMGPVADGLRSADLPLAPMPDRRHSL
ncbi:hypothetical protein RSOL_241270, partial [Rhizoctonia solani AG-3 Rhs1AP]